MPAGARLLGVEHVLPEGAGQASGKLTDVNMMVIAGGRERTEAEYRRLFAAHGFRPTRVVPTRGRRVWDRGLAGLKASISSRRSKGLSPEAEVLSWMPGRVGWPVRSLAGFTRGERP